MNAIERRNRRVKRLVVMKRIYEIEMKNCRVCPNRATEYRGACEKCPVMKQLSICGSELLIVGFREKPPALVEHIAELDKRKSGRKTNEEKAMSAELTRELFLQERVSGLWVREIQQKYKMSRTALQYRLQKWGFRYLSQERAKELLAEGERA